MMQIVLVMELSSPFWLGSLGRKTGTIASSLLPGTHRSHESPAPFEKVHRLSLSLVRWKLQNHH
jgi:hypothetical protein